jgi:type III secretory pathway component EscS
VEELIVEPELSSVEMVISSVHGVNISMVQSITQVRERYLHFTSD